MAAAAKGIKRTTIMCDFCSQHVKEAWVYAHDEFEFYDSVIGRVRADPGTVAACDGCRPFVDRRDPASLFKRIDLRKQSSTVQTFHRTLVEHILGDSEHITVDQLPISIPEQFTGQCVNCAHVFELQRSMIVDGTITVHCPDCKAEQLIGPFPTVVQ
jgi:hypothetical protein